VRIPDGFDPRPLERVTPTMFEALHRCMLRAAFRTDRNYSGMARPTPAATLGKVSHKLAEEVVKGEFGDVDEHFTERLAAEWDALVNVGFVAIQAAAELGEVPPPPRWRGYNIVRTRTLRRLMEVSESRGRARRDSPAPVLEQRIEAKTEPVAGTPDRVERSGGALEIIDLKTSWRLGDALEPAHRDQLLIYAWLWHDVNGEWPEKVSVLRLDGVKVSVDVVPSEAANVVRAAVHLFKAYNDLISDHASQDLLASPSEAACAWCPYRGACRSYLDQEEGRWESYGRVSFGGTVSRVEATAARLAVEVDVGDHRPMSRLRALLPPLVAQPLESEFVALVDAIPTPDGADVLVDWQTGLWVWS
jgi:hypothetical protein